MPLRTIVKNLQISNYTGSSITAAMVTVFIKTINDAYTYYRDSLTANTQYIQNRLEGSYSGYFQVLIFPENSTAQAYLYSISGTSTVAWTKVNTAKPLWSYIIVILSSPRTNTQLYGGVQHGSGMSELITNIENIIMRYETGKNCTCYTISVALDLNNLDGQSWNVACSSPKMDFGFRGQIRQKDEEYYQTAQITTGKCSYLFWVV